MKLNIFIILALYTVVAACSGSSFSGKKSNKQTPDPFNEDLIGRQGDITDAEQQKIIEELENDGIVDTATLEKACESAAELKTLTTKLSFPERQDCSFGANGNGERLNGFVQARETQTQTISLEGNSIICDMTFNTKANAQIRYDDFIFFAVEKQVIFGSNGDISNFLPKQEGIYQWDFNAIQGKEIDNFQSPYYCLGEARSCRLPPHDETGPIAIKLQTSDIAPIAFKVVGRKQIQAELISTGDNDDEDCYHSDLDLDVEISFLPIQ